MQQRAWIFAAAAALCGFSVTAVRSDDAAPDSQYAGTPTRVEIFPPAIRLVGPRSRMQVVVTGHYADGSVRDLTRVSQLASTSPDTVTIENAVALPHRDGPAQIAV